MRLHPGVLGAALLGLVAGVVVGALGAYLLISRSATEPAFRVRSKPLCTAALQTLGELEAEAPDARLLFANERYVGAVQRAQDAADRNCTARDLPRDAALPTPQPRAPTAAPKPALPEPFTPPGSR